MTTKVFKSAILTTAAAALAAATLAPSLAAAQQQYGRAYDQNGQYYYDGCSREQSDRAVVGGATGALAGAIIGNSLVNKRRDNGQGALVGGLVGAIAGAAIGQS